MRPMILTIGVAATVMLGATEARAATALLTWDPGGPDEMITGWKIYYDRDGAGAPYEGTEANEGPSPIDLPVAQVADLMAPSFELTGLESCVSYWFAVTAYNDAGESDYSGEVEKKIVAAPENLTAVSEAPGEVRLTWVAPPAGDPGVIPNYQIFYDLDGPGEPYSGAGSPLGIPAANEVTLTGLTTRATYWFVVDSVCDNFASKRSGEVSTVVIHEFPAPPDMGPGNPLPPIMMPEMDMGTADSGANSLAPDSGCGCTAARSRAPVELLLLGVAGAVLRRRRRHVT